MSTTLIIAIALLVCLLSFAVGYAFGCTEMKKGMLSNLRMWPGKFVHEWLALFGTIDDKQKFKYE